MNPKPDGRFMNMAAAEAQRGFRKGEGGPFGAVIVVDGRVVARAHNRVLAACDPTAHAEVEAIRKACRRLGHWHLADAELYATCEPCPMCLAAVHWARIRRVYYGCTSEDAARAGFDDKLFADSLGRLRELRVEMVPFLREECLPLFEEWVRRPDRVVY